MDRIKAQKGFAPILLVLLVVVIAAAGYYFLVVNPSVNLNNSVTRVLPPTKKAELNLSVDSPTTGTVIQGNLVTVKGKTLPNSTVSIYSDTDQNIVESDTKGNFEGQIKLTGGINSLTVTSFGDNGEEKSLSVDIVNNS